MLDDQDDFRTKLMRAPRSPRNGHGAVLSAGAGPDAGPLPKLVIAKSDQAFRSQREAIRIPLAAVPHPFKRPRKRVTFTRFYFSDGGPVRGDAHTMKNTHPKSIMRRSSRPATDGGCP